MTNEFFVPENLKDTETKEILSPSGRFKVRIQYYGTKPGSWNYSRGIVTRVADGAEICDIKRNYSSFTPCNFVMKNDEEWLIAGRSYMGQTLVNLDTGQEFNDEKHPDKYKGFEFCWVNATPSPNKNTLLVDGCVWAAPYEYRFYDFTDPSKGWPELEIKAPSREYPYADDGKKPIWKDANTVECYQTAKVYKPLGVRENDIELGHRNGNVRDNDQKNLYWRTSERHGSHEIPDADMDGEEKWEYVIDARRTFQRQGDKMVMLEAWHSDHEKEERRQRDEWDAKWKANTTRWKKEDPLHKLIKEKIESKGMTYKGTGFWIPSFNSRESGEDTNPAHFKVSIELKSPSEKLAASIEWGVEKGDVKAGAWTYGIGEKHKEFERSLSGLDAALDHVHQHLSQAQESSTVAAME